MIAGLYIFGRSITKPSKMKYFVQGIVEWDKDIDRGMPWQGEQDPYLIWLSEILLQQTRVEQGLPYYLKFKAHYPTIEDLALAEDDEVFRLWQGLGYYNRCRNLLFTARHIANNLNGQFPRLHRDILQLKGVGPYTAAAISSFAYGEHIPVIDGNVTRVVSRYGGILESVDSKAGLQAISEFSQKAINQSSDPAEYNQAIMNFGAVQCTPKRPDCQNCILREKCFAFKAGMVQELPRKDKKIKKRKRYFIYLHLEFNNQLIIQKRTEKDIWQQLYQMPLIEVAEDQFSSFELTADLLPFQINVKELTEGTKYGIYTQQLTHQRIHVQYLKFSLSVQIDLIDKRYLWVKKSELDSYAFPRVLLDYFKTAKQELLF